MHNSSRKELFNGPKYELKEIMKKFGKGKLW